MRLLRSEIRRDFWVRGRCMTPWTRGRAGAALLVRNPEIWLDSRPSVFWLRRFLVSSVGPRTPHSGTPPLASPSASPAPCESARLGAAHYGAAPSAKSRRRRGPARRADPPASRYFVVSCMVNTNSPLTSLSEKNETEAGHCRAPNSVNFAFRQTRSCRGR